MIDQNIKLIDSLVGISARNAMFSYMDYILEKNKYINLTAIKDRDEFIEKNIIDSLSVLQCESYRKAKKILDLGTGAGFPGVLLAIANPEKRFVLLDARMKKLKVIEDGITLLGLKNIELLHGRAEDLAKEKKYFREFDVCTSRAVANIENLIKLSGDFINVEGGILAYKGKTVESELEAGKETLKKLKFYIKNIYKQKYRVDSISGHVIVEIKKVSRETKND